MNSARGRIYRRRGTFGGEPRDDDGVVEGDLSPPAPLIEHEAEPHRGDRARASFAPESNARPHRAAAAPSRQGGCLRRQVRRWRGGEDPGALRWTTFDQVDPSTSPPPVTREIGSTSGSGTMSSSTRTSSAVSIAAGHSTLATSGRRRRTTRLTAVTIRRATMNGVLNKKRRRGRRWGSRVEAFRNQRSRRVRGDIQPGNRYVCPGGKELKEISLLVLEATRRSDQRTQMIYFARQQDCHACALKPQCCPAAKSPWPI